MAKTVDGVTTGYVLDPAAGLTQVLQETTTGQATSYLYGHDLLAQYDSGTWAYHVDDGLGSVRQLADPAGQVVMSYSFSPFGVPLGESGGEPYGFTGEQWDDEVELVYLRARYMQPSTGRFITQDPWPGDRRRPLTMNTYLYVAANPVNIVDPSGRQLDEEDYEDAWQIYDLLLNEYGVLLSGVGGYWYPLAPFSHEGRTWCPGGWKLSEMALVLKGVEDLASLMGSARRFRQHFSMEASYGVQFDREEWEGYGGATLQSGSIVYIVLTDAAFGYGDVNAKWTIVHELAHAWDAKHGGSLSRGLEDYTRGRTTSTGILWWRKTDYIPGCWPVPACVDVNFNKEEDFAESVAAFVYPQEVAGRALRRSKEYRNPRCAYTYWGITSFYETKRAEYIARLLYLH